MTKVYFVCDYTDDRASAIDSCPNIGIEYLGNCSGRALLEDGTKVGEHFSSSFGWLRSDLGYHAKKHFGDEPFEVVDLIGQPVPEQFKNAI